MQENIVGLFGNTVFTYRREQALKDGILIDVTKMAQKAGFTIPVAITDTVWSTFIVWTDNDTQQQTYQDTNGRLWDVLSMLRFSIGSGQKANCIHYKLNIVPRDGRTKKAKLTLLKAAIGAGDNGEPVITVMLPNEA
jgi:hypothetical protein